MTGYEIKKVFSKTSSRIAIALLLAIIGLTCFFAADVSYVDENGVTQSGPAAVARLKAAQKEWAGPLDEEMLQKVIAENVRIRNTPEARSQNVTESNIAYSWGQGIGEIRNLLNCSYAKEFRDYDYYRADSLTEADAADFYENRVTLLKEWLANEAKDQFSEAEKAYLIRQYESFRAPMYYDYMAGWRQLFEFAPTAVMLIMLFLGYLVAGIFANEFIWRSDAIFFSSVYGRNKAILAKIKAGFWVVTVVYFAAFLIYTGAVLLYLGADGWQLAVQCSWGSWKCMYHITNWQKYLIILFGGYIGCLFISFLGMLVSAKTKSSVLAVMVPVVLIFVPSFIANINSSAVSKILALFPDQLLQAGEALDYFNLFTIGKTVFPGVMIILILYALLAAVLMPVVYRVYRRLQVNG